MTQVLRSELRAQGPQTPSSGCSKSCRVQWGAHSANRNGAAPAFRTCHTFPALPPVAAAVQSSLPNVCSTTLGDLFTQTPHGERSASKSSKADLPEFSFPKAGLPKEKRTRCIKLKSRQPNPGIEGSNLGELGRADPCDNIYLRIRYLNRSLLGVKSMNVFYFFVFFTIL